MLDNRNLLLAIVISIGILLVFQMMMPPPEVPPPTEEAGAPGAPPAPGAETGAIPTPGGLPAPSGVVPGTQPAARQPATGEQTPRIPIEDGRVSGSIPLAGARIDSITLKDYRQTPDPDSSLITLLSPPGTRGAFYAELGWVAADGTTPVPAGDTLWATNDRQLSRERPLKLSWDNGAGLRFARTVELADDFLLTVEQSVANDTASPVTLYPYGLVSRSGTPETSGFFILHEGPLGVLGEGLQEHDYDDLADDGEIKVENTQGWLGITDKYWLTALIPEPGEAFTARFLHRLEQGIDKYQTDYLRTAVTVPPGGRVAVRNHVFAGAKKAHLLDRYRDDLDFAKFDLAIDFGWFYFLTKPFFYALSWLQGVLGNFGLAILALTVGVKLVFFPLANKSYRSMSQMKALQPEMVKLRERLGDDRQKLNQEMMALYKREKVNPAAGCLPILIQIPVFFALYKVLFVAIEMRHAPFYGWIEDLSAVDPTNLFTLFGLVDWGPPSFLHLGVWPILMGLSMWAQMRLNPTPADPIQAKIFQFMPLVFTFLLATFPAGLVIYWTWNNLLSMAQQWVIMRRHGVTRTAAGKT
ncbi:MAG: membrane protein insertase YidC [Alphaproteobacteria bacterium]|nr:membrane protein insertase YidC [Alphaproteobacteria bacterium]